MSGAAKRPSRPYAGRSAEERRADRRRRLLDAGLELFGAGPGYRTSSVPALCARADLSTRQFYEEFRNLEDALTVLYQESHRGMEEAVIAALGEVAEDSGLERVAAAFGACASAAAADPRRMRIMFVEVVGVSPDLERRRLQTRVRWAELLLAQLAVAAERGEIAARDYRLTAFAFLSAVNGLLYSWSAGAVEATLDQIQDELMRFFLGVFGSPGRKPA
ncbi:TetR/AcrR family transcriptional regulator [Streptomyces sp. B1866]|uniref:TetR/AcrR family transcriptional regulator n=1 Tax=Streptomyces sp. B1866 TaxID=3075431 RepID=UPI00288F4186|nr:TetR/AcrR family transcriptional regulator [Streptomyces sp. B1866]MDT3398391.1 TetR/AcrR family transcriptional regulator [Streptomyces sp. B1866]